MKIITQKITLLISLACFVGCGLSGELKEHLANLYTDAATKECNCKKMSKEDPDYIYCVEDYETAVRYIKIFHELHETSDAEKQEASMEADEIRAQCI